MSRDNGVYAYRRHLRTCHFFGPGGREVRSDKCDCPFHADGIHNGQRIRRRSLRTRSRQIADRRLAELARRLDAESLCSVSEEGPITVRDGATKFLCIRGTEVKSSTLRKYKTKLSLLTVFCERHRKRELNSVTLETLEDYRLSRKISRVTWKVELQTLRTFFCFCVRHKWIQWNPASDLRAPRNLPPNDVAPYTLEDERKIIAACDKIGGGKYNRSGARYEQVRARAMISLLRHTALRISDVAMFRRDAVSWDQQAGTWRLRVRTRKSGEAVYLPIPESLKIELDAVPLPRNAAQNCAYFFWSEQSSERAVVGIAERSLRSVFQKSEVKNAHAHRFRHTLATRLLEKGASFEQVADILGNTPEIVRKHYGKWSKGRQDNIDRLMQAHFQSGAATFPVTPQSHKKTGAVN